MTSCYGQPIRKKAAILPTKPHTRLHLNHVVRTTVAHEHCGEPHVWNACPSQNPRQARGEERKLNGFSYARNCHVPSIASQGSFSSASALDELGRYSTMLPGVDVLPSWR